MTDNQQNSLEAQYSEALEWLYNIRRFGSKLGLEFVIHLLNLMGNPHEDFKSIHIAGTNGKGSTTAMIASILRADGYRIGVYISPHLSSFTERIVVDGRQIPIEEVVRAVEAIRPHVDEMARDPELRHPTFFEVVTAMAFKYFSEKGVDFAVLEAGMGGKLDATNVIHSLVSVITNVSLEHTDVLGKTVSEIAERKAGIIKKGGVLLTATADEEVFRLFREVCRRKGSRIFRVGRDIRFRKLCSNLQGQSFQLDGLHDRFDALYLPLIGDHQLFNAALAVGAVEALDYHSVNVSKKAIEEGLKSVSWPGRLEIMQRDPMVLLDCAKDVAATIALKKAVTKEFKYEKLIMVVSISSDKNIPGMIEQFVQFSDYFIITSHGVMGRASDPTLIANEIDNKTKPYEIAKDVKEAIKRAMELAGQDDLILVLGSVFLVGEARDLWIEPSNR